MVRGERNSKAHKSQARLNARKVEHFVKEKEEGEKEEGGEEEEEEDEEKCIIMCMCVGLVGFLSGHD